MSTPVLDALSALGATPSQVVDTLLEKGIAGVPGSPTGCPVAIYLNHVFPGTQFEVSGLAVYDTNSLHEDWIPGFTPEFEAVSTPPAIEMFIAAFDKGYVPELVSVGAGD